MQYQDEQVTRVVEQMGSMLRLAFARFREGQSSAEPLHVTNQAVQVAVGVDADSFLRFSPQSMGAYIEVAGFDDRIVAKLADVLELQGEILEADGDLVIAAVRRDQAEAVRQAIDPSRAN